MLAMKFCVQSLLIVTRIILEIGLTGLIFSTIECLYTVIMMFLTGLNGDPCHDYLYFLLIFRMFAFFLSTSCWIKNFRIDFSYESNNWGIGLPPREKNEKSWPLY